MIQRFTKLTVIFFSLSIAYSANACCDRDKTPAPHPASTSILKALSAHFASLVETGSIPAISKIEEPASPLVVFGNFARKKTGHLNGLHIYHILYGFLDNPASQKDCYAGVEPTSDPCVENVTVGACDEVQLLPVIPSEGRWTEQVNKCN